MLHLGNRRLFDMKRTSPTARSLRPSTVWLVDCLKGATFSIERAQTGRNFPVDVVSQVCYKGGAMKAHELRGARLNRGFVQAQVAKHLGVSQAYVNMLEKGKRPMTPGLTRRAATLFGLSEALPVSEDFVVAPTDNQHLAESLAKLKYPGFAYLRSHVANKNPNEVLLTALGQDLLEARVAEALPWVVMQYTHGESTWLVEQARKFNLQNRLGFVVGLAAQVAEKVPNHNHRVQSLLALRAKLDAGRLAKEDVFYREPKSEGERRWLTQNRSTEAAHWNLLTDMKSEQLQYAV
jgi:transcriptional regulator with XRE-family HTH domain